MINLHREVFFLRVHVWVYLKRKVLLAFQFLVNVSKKDYHLIRVPLFLFSSVRLGIHISGRCFKGVIFAQLAILEIKFTLQLSHHALS